MTASGAPDAVHGLVRVAGLDLALPLAALREVVPCPEHLGDLPVDCPGLRGVLSLRGTLVPVLDLAAVLGRPAVSADAAVVVVVADGGRVLGLLVEQVRGMVTVPADALVEVVRDGPPLLFASTFPGPGPGEVVSLLEPSRLLALPGVPVALEPERRASAAGRAASGRRSLTVVRCGAFLLALDVAHVHATVPSPPLSPSPADGPTCLGVTAVADARVAVLDPLALLGLGSLAGTPLGCGLVLDLPDGQVVLGVGEMVGLHDVPADLVAALPTAGSPCPELLHQVADVAGAGTCLLVDGARLLETDDVVVLSRLTTPLDDEPDDATGSRSAQVSAGPPHLACTAGVPLAVELAQVAEVLAWPHDLVPSRGAAQVLGVTLHRGTALPVVDLAAVLGRPAPPHGPASRLLLTVVDGQAVTYAVSSLQAILPATWTDPSGVRPDGSLLQACPLVQLAGSDGLLPVLDLQALTRRLRGPSALPGPRRGEAALAPSG